MVLSILSNDDKIQEKKLPEVFRCKFIPKYYSLIQYFLAKAPVFGLHIEKVVDKFASKNIVPSSFFNQFLGQNTLVIHFEPYKKLN